MNVRAAIVGLSVLVPAAASGQLSAAMATAICRGPAGQSFANEAGKAIATAAADFEALGFGAGYGAVMSVSGAPRIQEAKVVAGTVRVEEDDDVQFGPILEMHKFSWALSSQSLAQVTDDDWVLVDELPDGCIPTGTVVRKVPLIGAGPFVTLRLGADEVVQSFGFGLMFGFRKAENDKSLNLGAAYVWDPNVKTLGDGIEANVALPAGETEVRYRTTSQGGILVMFSIGW